jgi:predicted outer membrane repeat protein
LRQVLVDAQSGFCIPPITFAPGVSWITLTSGQLTVPAMTVTIDGGAGVTVNGNNSSRVFWVNSGADVTFQNLTITNGYAGHGGGIYNDAGIVTIGNGGMVANNTATSNGGGIYSQGGMVTIASGGTVMNNSANASSGGIGNWSGTLTVNGTVSGNMAGTIGGGIVANVNFGTTTINGTVSNNTANWEGGGIYIRSDIGPSLVNFGTGNLIQGNTANGGAGSGGGIYNSGGTISGAVRNYGSGNTPENCVGVGCP